MKHSYTVPMPLVSRTVFAQALAKHLSVPERFAPKSVGALAAFWVALAGSPNAYAAEYSIEPMLRAWAEHDSNIRMTEDSELSAMGNAAEAGVLLKRRSEISSQELDLKVSSTRYNRDEFSSDDQHLRWAATRLGERSTLDLQLNIDRDTTRDSEISDTGVILGSDRRERYFFAPNWSYSLTERQLISIGGTAEAVRYDNERYAGYDYGQATLGWTLISSERMSWFLNGTYSKYESKESADLNFLSPFIPPFFLPFQYSQSYSTESETYGAQLGGEYSWSEQLSLSVLVGRSRSENSYDVNDPLNVCGYFVALNIQPEFLPAIGLCGLEDNDGDITTLNAGLEWTGERHHFNANVLSQTQPSADGYLVESERFSVGWDYRLTERSRLFLNATYGRNEALESSPLQIGADRSNRDFIDARLRYRHQLTAHWFIEADYRYRYSDREIIAGVGESNVIMVGVRFEPQAWRWSR